jgi:hypothetical protein
LVADGLPRAATAAAMANQKSPYSVIAALQNQPVVGNGRRMDGDGQIRTRRVATTRLGSPK